MTKQTIRVKASVSNVTNSTAHLNPPSVPIKTALEMAMEKSGMLANRDKKPEISLDLVGMYENLERQMLMLRAAIHHDKISKGIVSVDQNSPLCAVTPVLTPEPVMVNHKTGSFFLDSDIHIIGKTKITKPRTIEARVESAHADDFDELPVTKKTTAVKAETVKRDDHKAGKNAFRDTFRDAVIEAFRKIKPGFAVEAHTVNAEDPTSTKFRVRFIVSHLGSTIKLERLSPNPKKAFEVEIPLKAGKLDPNTIPAFAYELKK
jgi:hypothetical protein